MPIYETTFRKKFIPITATGEGEVITLSDLIAALEREAAALREMQAAGVVLAEKTISEDDDYYCLCTSDPTVAAKFEMEELEEEEPEDEDEYD